LGRGLNIIIEKRINIYYLYVLTCFWGQVKKTGSKCFWGQVKKTGSKCFERQVKKN